MSKIDNGHWLCFVAGCLCGCAVEMSSASACHYSPLGWCVRRPKIKFGHATHAIWLHNADKAKHTQNTAPFMPVARFSCVTKRSVSASFISSVPVPPCVRSARWLLYLRQRLVPQRVSEAPKKSAIIHCIIRKGCCCCTNTPRYMDSEWDTHKHRIIIVATASHIISTSASGINVYLYFLRFVSQV